MQKIEITYNPYKMETTLLVDGGNVCNSTEDYGQFKEFIETGTPLQTWIEPIQYKNWQGIVDELRADDEGYDILDFHFHGRVIDFEDLKRSCEMQNAKRQNPLGLSFEHDTTISDEKLAHNIDVIMDSLLSDRFAEIVKTQGEESSAYIYYQELEENYQRAKKKEFKIVFAGLYSSGKSTILNSLIRHHVLPTSDKTCTAKTCRIRHSSKLKSTITLECFDKQGSIVVPKETFSTDEECLNRFWEITPLGAKESVPENIDVIELCMDLSHLYPSKEMEQAFNLVIIDTPGCNSRKKTTQNAATENEASLNNTDKKLALEAITNGEREMVVVCADAQDYDDESVGDFLKAIHEASREDVGDFNDRFLFVLNKCDNLKFNNGEKIINSKHEFADYLMDTRRWGIRETSLKFVPRVFMISAYNCFALQQGVSTLSEEDVNEDEEKQNLWDAYDDFSKKVIKRKNDNYFLSQACDVPDYRKEKFAEEFESAVGKDNDYALKIQTGICCIESAIQDYIARYAYPIKVKSLMETFDLLLESVKDFSDLQVDLIKKCRDDMGKNTTERKGVQEKQKAEEEKETVLRNLKEKVETEKNKINSIHLNLGELQKIRGDMDYKIETNSYISRVRKATAHEKLSDAELKLFTHAISSIFSDARVEVDKAFASISEDYKGRVKEICDVLNGIAAKIQRYNIYGYNFSSSLALKRIQLRDAQSLAKEIQNTKQTKSGLQPITKPNPVKDIEYKKWQVLKRIKQYWAKDTITEFQMVEWNEYSLSSLKTYVTDISGEFKKLSTEAEQNYKNEIQVMKNNASKMADAIVRDINTIANQIEVYKEKIDLLGKNTSALQTEIESHNKTIDWLKDLIDLMNNGGQVDE